MGDKLTDGTELLYRQIHPNFIDNGEPSSDRFRPSPKDENKMSVDRSSIFTAEQSFSVYTGNGRASAAVYGVSVQEFGTEIIPCFADPLPAEGDQIANPAHALADFAAHSAKAQKLVAKKLKRFALARGRLHPP